MLLRLYVISERLRECLILLTVVLDIYVFSLYILDSAIKHINDKIKGYLADVIYFPSCMLLFNLVAFGKNALEPSIILAWL